MRANNLFYERENYEYGFSNHYAWDVLPAQQEVEQNRKRYLKKFWFRLMLTLPVFLLYVGFILWSLAKMPDLDYKALIDHSVIIIMGFVLFIYPLYSYLFATPHDYIREVKNKVFKNVITFYKGFHYLVSGEICPLDVKDSKLLPKFLSYSSEDKIVGTHNNVNISMAEVKLMKPRLLKPIIVLLLDLFKWMLSFVSDVWQGRPINARTGYYTKGQVAMGKLENKVLDYSDHKFQEWFLGFRERALEKTMFNGIFITFDLPRSFYGTTIGLKDGGSVGNMIKAATLKRLKKVSLESAEFEKIFEVYSTSQIESRCVLNPAFMARLIDLSKSINDKGKKGMTFSFYQDKGFIMIPQRRNLFEPRSMFRSCVNTKDSKKFLKEMSILFDIIDILKLNMDKNYQRVHGN